MNQPRQYGKVPKLSSNSCQILLDVKLTRLTKLQWNKDLVGFSTSVKRLLALQRGASAKGNDESKPKGKWTGVLTSTT